MIHNRATDASEGEMARADALREWLGVSRAAPTLYEIIGAPNLARDRKAIFEAGRQTKRKLRPYQIGRYRKRALDVLTEVGRAVSVLTNPKKKRAYDHDLLVHWAGQAEKLWTHRVAAKPGDSAAVRAWVAACRAGGIPIVRVLPHVLRHVQGRGPAWPPHGEHALPLPACLWIYRDVVVLGQCIERGDIPQRAQTVKRVQKALKISESTARLVAADVGHNLEMLANLRLVRQARRNPRRTILRLARRLRRLGGHIDRHSKVLQASAALLGQSRYDLMEMLGQLDGPPVDIPAVRRMAIAAKKAQERARQKSRTARDWVAHRPQILVGLGLAIGLAAVVLATIVLLRGWGKEGPREPVHPPTPAAAANHTTSHAPPRPPVPPPPKLLEFIHRYPANPPPPKPEPPPTPTE